MTVERWNSTVDMTGDSSHYQPESHQRVLLDTERSKEGYNKAELFV